MGRSGVITFKGAPLTLAGNEVKAGRRRRISSCTTSKAA